MKLDFPVFLIGGLGRSVFLTLHGCFQIMLRHIYLKYHNSELYHTAPPWDSHLQPFPILSHPAFHEHVATPPVTIPGDFHIHLPNPSIFLASRFLFSSCLTAWLCHSLSWSCPQTLSLPVTAPFSIPRNPKFLQLHQKFIIHLPSHLFTVPQTNVFTSLSLSTHLRLHSSLPWITPLHAPPPPSICLFGEPLTLAEYTARTARLSSPARG